MTITAAPITPARAPSSAAAHAQVARGHRQRAADRGLAHAREQLLRRLGEVAADDDRARVEEVDALGQHLADGAAGAADGLQRERLSRARVRDDVADRPRRQPRRRQVRRQRVAARDGLQAAGVPARAEHVVVAGEPDVADVARRAVGAAVDGAAGRRSRTRSSCPTVTKSRWSTSRQCVQCSPSAIRLTWLSTSTGAS